MSKIKDFRNMINLAKISSKQDKNHLNEELDRIQKIADSCLSPLSYDETMNVYLIQSTDYLKDQAIQNAIVVAENRSVAIKKFSKELRHNPYCRQSYRSMWFSCKKININKPKMLIQYGGDTWQFDEVEYGQE